jgi:hypothetical protein
LAQEALHPSSRTSRTCASRSATCGDGHLASSTSLGAERCLKVCEDGTLTTGASSEVFRLRSTYLRASLRFRSCELLQHAWLQQSRNDLLQQFQDLESGEKEGELFPSPPLLAGGYHQDTLLNKKVNTRPALLPGGNVQRGCGHQPRPLAASQVAQHGCGERPRPLSASGVRRAQLRAAPPLVFLFELLGWDWMF